MFELYPSHLKEPDIAGSISLAGPKRRAEGSPILVWVRSCRPVKPYCYAIPDQVRVEEVYVIVQIYQTDGGGARRLVLEQRLEWEPGWRLMEIAAPPVGIRECEVIASLFYDETPYWTATKQIRIGRDIRDREWALSPAKGQTLDSEEISFKAPFSGLLYAIVGAAEGGVFYSMEGERRREHRLAYSRLGVQERCLGFAEKGESILIQAGRGVIPMIALYWQALEPEEAERFRAGNGTQRDRCVVVNNDGFSEGFVNAGWDISQLKEQVLRYRNTGVSALHWCTLLSDVASYRSSVIDFFGDDIERYPAQHMRIARENFHKIETETSGLLPTLNEIGRSIGLPIWASLRMNTFYGFHPFGDSFNGRFWFAHPELRIQWSTETTANPETPLSFAYEEVCQRRIDFLLEASRLGCEGVHLDFCRYPWTMGYDAPLLEEFESRYETCGKAFPLDDPRWIAIRQSRMTEFMRSLRNALKREEEKSGRKVPVAVRLPATKWSSFGFDPVAWVGEGLVDILIPAFPGHDRWFDIEPWVAMAAATPVKVLGGVEYFRFETAPTELTDAEVENGTRPGMRGYHYRDSLLSRIAYFYEKGASGVYLFNAWEDVPVMENLEQSGYVARWKRYEAPEGLLSLPEGLEVGLAEADLYTF